jgi:hypothetical protein
MEVFKYAVKFSDQPVADTARLSDAQGETPSACWCFRGVEVLEELTDEPR